MTIDFISLFPEMILGGLNHSIVKRAVDSGLISFNARNPRDFTTDAHRTVDDRPFGGGAGMVMKCQPIVEAFESLEPILKTHVIIPDPTGRLLTQSRVAELALLPRITIVCGHYEGIDDRVAQILNAEKLSIGDYILSGAELAAMIIADAVVRSLPGALGNAESLAQDTFSDGLLSAPQYTRPEVFQGIAVPEVLLSGDHGAVSEWRRLESLKATRLNRPDLFARATLEKSDANMLSS